MRSRTNSPLGAAAVAMVITTNHDLIAETGSDLPPATSRRRNIVVIADEAHRSQYGVQGKLNQKTGTIDWTAKNSARAKLAIQFGERLNVED